MLFDRFREHRNKLRARKIVGLLRRIERAQVKAGWPHWRRRQWWRDFIKNPIMREQVLDSIERQTHNEKSNLPNHRQGDVRLAEKA